MSYGIEKARKIQYGIESVHGTAVAATIVHAGKGEFIKDDSTVVNPNLDFGKIVPVLGFGYKLKNEASLVVPEHDTIYEQATIPLNSGIAYTAGTANGGTTTATIYTYTLPTTAVDDSTIKTMTIEAGDNIEVREMEYSYADTISYRGAVSAALTQAATYKGRQSTVSGFTSISAPTVLEQIPFSKGKLYLDSSGGTIGTTQITGAFVGVQVDIKTGWQPVYSGDGQLYFTALKNVGPTMTGRVKFEYTGDTAAIEAYFLSQATKLLRIEFPGSALSGSGGAFSTKLLRFNAAVRITSYAMSAANGDNQVEFSFEAGYSATDAIFASVIVVV